MKLSEILRDVEVTELHASPDMEISGISYDSRKTKDGDMFVAITGFASDGHRFIPTAAEKGASVILCEHAPELDIPYVLVKDSRYALAICSCRFFDDPSSEMTVIGITGTNGKTTTTYLVKHMLEDKLGAKVGLVGTNGNMIGSEFIPSERTTPESYELQRLFRQMKDAGCSHVIMEVSSHSLVLNRVAGIKFDVGIFSNLTQDHLDFHKTMDEYAKAKAKLFRLCKVGCINIDDAWAEKMMEDASCTVFRYSAEKDAELRAENIVLAADGVSFTAVCGGEKCFAKLKVPGKFSVYNALSVISAGLALGMSLEDCCAAICTSEGVKGRMELVPTEGDYTILIDYAHTPDALENALKALRTVSDSRLVVLFGCGGDRDKLKRPIMGGIAADYADFVIVTSDNPRTEKPEDIISDILEGMKDKKTPGITICDRVEAIKWAIDNHRKNDVILLAGKGHEDYQVVGTEKHHLDEREIVAEHIATKRRG